MAILAYATGMSSVTKGIPPVDYGSTVSTYKAPDALESFGVEANLLGSLSLDFASLAGDFWVSFYYYHRNTAWSAATWLSIRSGAEDFIYFTADTTEDSHVYWKNGAGTTTVGNNIGLDHSILARVDVQFIRAVSGAVRVYKNNTLIAEFTGDTTTNAAQPDNILFGAPSTSAVGDTKATHYSSVMVADEDTRDITAIQNSILGDGLQTGMTGSYLDVDELGPLGDTDKIISSAANQVQTLTKSTLPAPYTTGFDVVGLGVYARTAVSIPAIGNMEFVQTDNTNTATSGDIAVSGLLSPKFHIFPLASDGTAWDVTKLNNTDIGVKSKA